MDEIISPTRMALGSIEQDIPVHELLHLAQLKGGELALLEAQISDNSPAVGRRPADLQLPEGCSLFLLLRGSQVCPLAATRCFEAGDKVLAVSRTEDEANLRRELIGEDEAPEPVPAGR